MSRYEGLREKADYVVSMLTPRTAERKCFSAVNYQNLARGIEETSIKLVQARFGDVG